eukprot:2307459-Pleurochrysis_carterae.AAC.1
MRYVASALTKKPDPSHPGDATIAPRAPLSFALLLPSHMKLLLLVLALTFFAPAIQAGPVAYAACQAAAAAGCAAAFGPTTAGLGFGPCYAAAQAACATTLPLPTP